MSEPYPLRPLTRDYARDNDTIEHIESVWGLPPAQIVSLLRKNEDYRFEALVYYLREFKQAGEDEACWALVEALLERISKTVPRYLAKLIRIGPDLREELMDKVHTDLYQRWLNLGPDGEFWEVRFSLCLKRILTDVVKDQIRLRQREIAHSQIVGGPESGDYLERVANHTSDSPEAQFMAKEALRAIPEPMRTALFLVRFQELSQEEAAIKMGCTSRTIRNYLIKAEAALRAWWSPETS